MRRKSCLMPAFRGIVTSLYPRESAIDAYRGKSGMILRLACVLATGRSMYKMANDRIGTLHRLAAGGSRMMRARSSN